MVRTRSVVLAAPRAGLVFVSTCWLAALATCTAGGPPAPKGPTPTTLRTIEGPVSIIDGTQTPAPTVRMGDRATIGRILDEGKHRNRVMDHLRHISEEIGPRLTGSSNAETANRWAMEQFASWGLSDAHIEQWGTIPVRFDRGESWGRALLKDEKRDEKGTKSFEWKSRRDMEVTTLAWTRGTPNGEPLRGPVVRMPDTREQYEAIKDQLDGAWVLITPPPQSGRSAGPRGPGQMAGERYRLRKDAHAKLASANIDESSLFPDELVLRHKINGFVSSSRDERVWTTSCPNWRELDPANIPDDVEVMIRLSDYDYLNSRLTDGEEVQLEFKLDNRLTPGPIPVYNTVAEIRGTTKPGEYVIVSGHLDSWNGPGSQGTTDNGTGSSVTLEAARLLMAAHARPARTIRFILWTGEEQGLLGSRAYVKAHPELLPRISAVFVDDGGTNSEGGLQCTKDMVAMLAAATAPVNFQFADDKTGEPLNVNIQPKDEYKPTGGSDHYSFFEAGVPGFFWDEVGRADYGHGWHTQHDRIDLAIPAYLEQSATCAAITAYNLACAETMLPRWNDQTGPTLTAPSRVSASNGSHRDYIYVNWGEVPAATAYNVLRAESDDVTKAQAIASALTITHFEDRTAAPDVMHWYWIETISTTPSQTARSEKPDTGYRGNPPAVLAFKATTERCGGVELTWDALAGITGYDLFISASDAPPSADAKPSHHLIADATFFIDERAPADGASRHYFLRASSHRGLGAFAHAEGRTKACP